MIKYGVKLLHWKNDPNPQGLFPIYIRVTVNGERKYIATGIFLSEKHWDAKSEQVKEGHAMHAVYNPDLTERKRKIVRVIVEKQLAGQAITAGQVKAMFSGALDLHNVFDFIDEYSKTVQYKRADSTLENYTKFARKLELFHGSRKLSFESIDPGFLQRFEDSLRAEGLADNYVWANFKMLKTFFNAAIKKQIVTAYPFGQYENPEYRAGDKDRLTLPELATWEKYSDAVTDPVDKQTACYFLFGCYTGLRISDWYQFDIDKHVVGNHLRLRAKKNGEWVTMLISKPLANLLSLIRETPLKADEPVINRALKDIATRLGIKKHITTHCGRHTFAVTICAENGIGVEVCAELMGITVQTCVNNYYKTTKTKIDAECARAWKGL